MRNGTHQNALEHLLFLLLQPRPVPLLSAEEVGDHLLAGGCGVGPARGGAL